MAWFSLSLIRDIFHDPRSTFLIFKTESIRAQWQDVGGLAAACCSASPSGAHSPPWGREPTGECCLRDSPAARPYPGTASARSARPTTPSASPAALPPGWQRGQPQVWCLRARHLTPGQPTRAPVHGESGPLLPVHPVHEDLPAGNRPPGAPVCSGGAEAICVRCVQDGVLAAHLTGATSHGTHWKQPHEMLHL